MALTSGMHSPVYVFSGILLTWRAWCISWAPQLMEGVLTYRWDKGSLPTSIFNSLPFTFSAAEMGSPQVWLMTLNRLNQHCSTVSSLCRQCVLILGFDFTQSFFCLFLAPCNEPLFLRIMTNWVPKSTVICKVGSPTLVTLYGLQWLASFLFGNLMNACAWLCALLAFP